MKGSGRGFFSALTAFLYTGNALGMDGDGITGSSLGFTSPQTLGCCWQMECSKWNM